MASDQQLLDYVLRLADSDLILAQRLGEWVGHGPVLEEDIALTNVGLDLLGQAERRQLEDHVRRQAQRLPKRSAVFVGARRDE